MSRKSQQRIEAIVATVTNSGHQPIRSIAETLGVSEMTVRRDVVESRGRLAVLGGQVVAKADGATNYALDSEETSHVGDKRIASRHAAGMIDLEDTIFLDCGSTTAHLAALIPPDLGITVVTYALNIAAIVSRIPGVRLVMIGGIFHGASASFSGPEGLRVIEGVRLNKAFISAGGVHRTLGVSCSNFYEVPAKLTALKNAANAYVLADSSKYGRVKPAHFAELTDFNGFVNERGVFPRSEIEAFC
ncbi:DeoR/GlpR transcriptional regulator [Arsenicitalea aurantiaca]|uniref:DeoR/GlpR transcriptional regulator n=1 Tax=Arsenicitalea aurantiaca TaxID=1783274 RepID=A0A433X2S9_9HYPH|nr:DeoR/GlpR family DNA-binding transcription regulator [Arsenicitalea aurantiaca]RUT28365.1 DeoR/GlpR transcriptional regulator [Arsenicitalea aurantiaca]